MSKLSQEQELSFEEYETDITDEDYGFIISADGKLKSVFLPETGKFRPPKEVQKVLKVFGILDIDNVDKLATLH